MFDKIENIWYDDVNKEEMTKKKRKSSDEKGRFRKLTSLLRQQEDGPMKWAVFHRNKNKKGGTVQRERSALP